MKIFDLKKDHIEFKHLLSAPAPAGRILNYIYLCGQGKLFHINGYRYLDYKGQVGSAWATEFMIGLGLVRLGNQVQRKHKLDLTVNGLKIYELIKTNPVHFTESSSDSGIIDVKKQMNECHKDLFETFRKAFVESYPFLILQDFLQSNGFVYENRVTFMDDLFETVKKEYDPSPYNRNARLSTGRNRVPSLLQLCDLFGFVTDSNGRLTFDSAKINGEKTIKTYQYTQETLQKAAENEELIEKEADELAAKYGESGNKQTEIIVRNSELQRMFRHNLLVLHKKCVLCGIENPELLIGSHIKPSSKSNVVEKCDHNNGLLLCGNHDKAFDRHLITFNNENGGIIISKRLNEQDVTLLGIQKTFALPREFLTEERKRYLREHNNEFYKKENN